MFEITNGFHSINVPSEWGQAKILRASRWSGFHSINVPSEWGLFLPVKQLKMV